MRVSFFYAMKHSRDGRKSDQSFLGLGASGDAPQRVPVTHVRAGAGADANRHWTPAINLLHPQ
jgi:hypothetical protein